MRTARPQPATHHQAWLRLGCEDVGVFARNNRYASAYTHREPSREEELALLVRWVMGNSEHGREILFVGPEKRSLENSRIANDLVRAGSANYTTWRSKDWWRHGSVIALWPNAKTLQDLDAVSTIKALGVLTWTLSDVLPWAAGVGAEDLLGVVGRDEVKIDDVLVLGALRVLTNGVNLSTGLSHPSDWDHAVEMFRALRKLGRAIDGDLIERWALGNGWSYRHAADLGQLAHEMAAGKAKRTKSHGGAGWRPHAGTVGHWREVGSDSNWKAF